MRRKFLLATLTTIVLGATAMPAAALDTSVADDSGSSTGIVHVEPTQEELGAVVVDADAEEDSGSLTAGGYLAPADEGGAVTVSASADGPTVEQDDYSGPTSDEDPIVIGQEGVGEVSVDPDTLTVGVKVEPLGVDESVSLMPEGDEEEEPAAEPAPAAPTTSASQPSQPAPAQPQATTQASTPAPASSGPREVFSTGPREVFPNAKPASSFEFSTPEVEAPVVADGVNAAGPLDDLQGSGTTNALLKLFALLMFGTTGYAWWFAKENGLA